MKLAVHDQTGKEVETIEVDDAVFGIEPNEAVVHQALVTIRANRRMGNATTKTRGEVHGSTRKIRKQKGTGSSRQGSIMAPQHRHGGIVFVFGSDDGSSLTTTREPSAAFAESTDRMASRRIRLGKSFS